MLKVGLTGNIGSGKSIVAEVFRVTGIPVYHADDESKAILSSPEVTKKVAGIFGNRVLDASGTINRQALAAIVFSNPSELKKLESVLHPLVREHSRRWMEQHKDTPYIIHEAAVIFESGFREEYDLVIHISCPREMAISRVMQRDGITRAQVEARMKNQWDDERKASLADFVIKNDGGHPVVDQVLAIHKKLVALAG